MTEIVIFGTGSFAELMHYYFTHESDHTVKGFTVDREYFKDTSFCGLPVVAFDEVEKHFSPAKFGMNVPVGYPKTCSFSAIMNARKRLYREAVGKGYELVNFIHPKALVSHHDRIGNNVILMEGCTVMPFVSIGNNVVIHSGTTIGHHAVLEHHVFACGNLLVAGLAHVGESSFLGNSSMIGDSRRIGKEAIVGVGSVVMEDMPDGMVCMPSYPVSMRGIRRSQNG